VIVVGDEGVEVGVAFGVVAKAAMHRRSAAADRRRWWLRQPRQSRRRQGPRRCRRRLPQEARHRHYREVKSPWVYRRLRNFRAGIEAAISCFKRVYGAARCTWRGLDHFKAYIWRRRGVQSGAVRPAQTGLAAPDCKPMKNRQIRSPSTARLPIPVQVVATNARNAPVAHRAHIVSPVLRRCKNAPLWTPTRLI
jgi:hypothetical protein